MPELLGIKSALSVTVKIVHSNALRPTETKLLSVTSWGIYSTLRWHQCTTDDFEECHVDLSGQSDN